MKQYSLLTICALFCAISLRAQQPVQLTLEQAVNRALTSNADLEISRLGIENSDQQIREARATGLPQITLNGGYTRNIQKPVFYLPNGDGSSKPVPIGASNALSGDVTVTQLLYNGGYFAAVKAAKTYSQLSREQLRVTAATTILDVKRAYYAVQLAAASIAVNDTLLANAQATYNNIEALYKAGLRAEFDALRAEVQLENQRPVVIQAHNNYLTALDNLKNLLNYPPGQEIQIAEPLSIPSGSTAPPALAEAQAILDRYNPQLQALRVNRDLGEETIDIHRADYLPTLSLTGKYQVQAQSDNFSGLNPQNSSFVGVNLSYNIFNGFRTTSQVEESKIALQQTDDRLRQTGNTLKTQLETALRQVDYARQRIDVGGKTIAQAQRGYSIAVASYNAGSGTLLGINDAGLALAQAQLNQLSAAYDYDVAMAQIEQLLGQNYQVPDDGYDVQYRPR